MNDTIACGYIRSGDSSWWISEKCDGTIGVCPQENSLLLKGVGKHTSGKRRGIICPPCNMVENDIMQERPHVHQAGKQIWWNLFHESIISWDKKGTRNIVFVQEVKHICKSQCFCKKHHRHPDDGVIIQHVCNSPCAAHENIINHMEHYHDII